jgi:hypothetical protein
MVAPAAALAYSPIGLFYDGGRTMAQTAASFERTMRCPVRGSEM